MNLLEFITKVDSTDKNFITVKDTDYRIRYFDKEEIPLDFKLDFPSDFKLVPLTLTQNNFCSICIFSKEVRIRLLLEEETHLFNKDILKDPSYAILSFPFLRKEL